MNLPRGAFMRPLLCTFPETVLFCFFFLVYSYSYLFGYRMFL